MKIKKVFIPIAALLIIGVVYVKNSNRSDINDINTDNITHMVYFQGSSSLYSEYDIQGEQLTIKEFNCGETSTYTCKLSKEDLDNIYAIVRTYNLYQGPDWKDFFEFDSGHDGGSMWNIDINLIVGENVDFRTDSPDDDFLVMCKSLKSMIRTKAGLETE